MLVYQRVVGSLGFRDLPLWDTREDDLSIPGDLIRPRSFQAGHQVTKQLVPVNLNIPEFNPPTPWKSPTEIRKSWHQEQNKSMNIPEHGASP